MSALRLPDMVPGSNVFMVGIGGTVTDVQIIAVKTRPSGRPHVCLATASALLVVEFWEEQFYPTAKECWYAAALHAQRKAQEFMQASANAFKKAGIAVGDDTTTTP